MHIPARHSHANSRIPAVAPAIPPFCPLEPPSYSYSVQSPSCASPFTRDPLSGPLSLSLLNIWVLGGGCRQVCCSKLLV